jgi:Uma2 family endonuclease
MNVALQPLADPSPTLADLVADLGGIPLRRIRLRPAIGAATVVDVEQNKGCELVDGTLVEKAMGFKEAILAAYLTRIIGQFVEEHELGFVVGPDGPWQLDLKLVRLPDVAFVSWGRLPTDELPQTPVPAIAPDLAIEVLCEGNTPTEMKRKTREYLKAGVSLVWIVDRFSFTVKVHRPKLKETILTRSGCLDGVNVLPGFRLSIEQMFAAMEKKRPRKK